MFGNIFNGCATCGGYQNGEEPLEVHQDITNVGIVEVRAPERAPVDSRISLEMDVTCISESGCSGEVASISRVSGSPLVEHTLDMGPVETVTVSANTTFAETGTATIVFVAGDDAVEVDIQIVESGGLKSAATGVAIGGALYLIYRGVRS